MDIGVVGAGICGLCTAVNFLEQGHKVTVYAEMLTPSTTSNVAPAVFLPHAVPATDLVLTAAQRTLEFYDRLPNGPTVGLRKQLHYELASERDYADTAILPFASLFPSFEELKRSLIPGGYEYGWYLTTYFIDSRQFMPYLMGRLQASGGNVVVQRQEDLAPSPTITEEILEGNRRIIPSLAPKDVIGVNTGLRPFRIGGPRVDSVDVGDKRILHNYGHGGGGWTLAWGCALILADLL